MKHPWLDHYSEFIYPAVCRTPDGKIYKGFVNRKNSKTQKFIAVFGKVSGTSHLIYYDYGMNWTLLRMRNREDNLNIIKLGTGTNLLTLRRQVTSVN